MAETFIYTYQTICEVSGKSYVGVHKTTNLNDGYIGCGIFKPSDAWRSKYPFHRAVKKYGYASFKRHILSFYDTYDEALAEERYIVSKEWVKNDINYNCALGGRGSGIYFMSDESKKEMYEKISVKKIGVKRPDYVRAKISLKHKGKKLSESHKANLKKSNARHWLGKPRSEETKIKQSITCTGRKLSVQHRQKLSLAKIGKPSNQRRPVLQTSINGAIINEFESVLAASKHIGCASSTIINSINGRPTRIGYVFKYKNQ